VSNTAPVLIWMSGTDKLCTYFNKPWLDFTGQSIESQLGNGWAQGIHAEDLQKCLDTYTQAFDKRENFRLEYRLRRNDGEYRWILDIGVPRFNPTAHLPVTSDRAWTLPSASLRKKRFPMSAAG
jgi:PAS domain S-box-containing protein